MKKMWLFWLLAALWLAACGQATPEPVATGAPTEAAIMTAAPTALIPTSGPASCIAQTGVFPTPDPALEAAFPSPGEDDWVQGSSTALLTIIEYSDFQ